MNTYHKIERILNDFKNQRIGFSQAIESIEDVYRLEKIELVESAPEANKCRCESTFFSCDGYLTNEWKTNQLNTLKNES